MLLSRWFILGLVLSAALLSGSCEGDSGIRGEPIRVGVIVSLTGGLASFGPHLAESALLAAREVQSAGGLLAGRPVEFIVVDDQTDPEVAARAARDLIDEEGVVAIVGPLASSASLAVQDITRSAGIPQLSCCSTSPELTNVQSSGEERFLFRTVPSDNLQGVVVARLASERMCTRLGIIHLSDSYGEGLAAVVRSNFEELVGSVVVDVPIESDRPSYAEAVASLVAASPDCVALIAFAEEGGTILREWSRLGDAPDVTWIGTDGVKGEGFPTGAGSAAVVDGVIGTAPITEPDTPQFNAYAADYEATFSNPVGIFGGSQYDAAALLLLAIESAGTTEGVAVRDALYRVSAPGDGEPFFGPGELAGALSRIRGVGTSAEPMGGCGDMDLALCDIDYEGASGPVDFDSRGDVVADYEIWRFDAEAEDFVRDDIVSASAIQ